MAMQAVFGKCCSPCTPLGLCSHYVCLQNTKVLKLTVVWVECHLAWLSCSCRRCHRSPCCPSQGLVLAALRTTPGSGSASNEHDYQTLPCFLDQQSTLCARGVQAGQLQDLQRMGTATDANDNPIVILDQSMIVFSLLRASWQGRSHFATSAPFDQPHLTGPGDDSFCQEILTSALSICHVLNALCSVA